MRRVVSSCRRRVRYRAIDGGIDVSGWGCSAESVAVENRENEKETH